MLRHLPAAVLVLGTALAVAPAAHAARAPAADLRVAATKPAAVAKPGDTVTVRVTLRNTGRGRAGASVTRLSLGAGRTYAAGDLVLASLRQRALAGGRKARAVTAKLRVPLDGRAAGTRTLVVCADAPAKVRERSEKDNCAVAGRITLPAVSAESLVAADLAAQRIDGEQATALRLLALAAPPAALPERYRGATSTGADATAAVTEAAARFTSYSPKTQALLAPLFSPPGHVKAKAKAKPKPKATSKPKAAAAALRPPDPNHCMAQTAGQVPDTTTMGSYVAPASKVTFWWPKTKKNGPGLAKALARELDATIWPKLTGLMARTPKADDNLDCAHGGSGGLDIYLVDMIGGRPWNAKVDPGPHGVTTPYTCIKGQPGSGFMTLADTSKETLAHEFFHLLQLAYADKNDCDRPGWLDEGTAEWAVEFTYPGTLKNTSAVWLEVFEGTGLLDRSYDAWPFWYSATREAGANVVRAAYHNTEMLDRIPAVDQAIGTFRSRWPEFARSAYNQAPVTSYTDWTKTTTKPNVVSGLLSLGGQSTKTVSYAGSAILDPLTRDYQGFAFEDKIRKVTLSGLPAGEDYKLLALLRMKDGSWTERDVSKGVTLCRDRPSEDVQEMVLVASNASPTAKLTADPTLTVEDACALPRFRVLSASFAVHTTGLTASKWGQSCDATNVSGTEDYSGELDGPVNDPAFKLTRQLGGGLKGDVFFDVPADGMTELQGCDEPDETPCTTTKSIRKADGKDTIGFEIEVEPHNPQEARLRWRIHEASIGYFDADDSVCNVYEFYNFVGPDQQVKTVPLEDLQHGTHTFSNKGFMSWKEDEKTSTPATLTLGWGYDVEIQVIDKDGNPIP
ncbi:MAG TPA: CARDB domain-containing protein [Baekduia sp.]|uniref:CARDB domain-containing protein n=1 Tax=Baekduia sp. TaxID=2600305 RepID=UPI002BCCD726|nr:CARDB domain-containing protein [Baekduia sp.]HMJ34214.1 CARDB domain-containing protein [Baekduia sp.]